LVRGVAPAADDADPAYLSHLAELGLEPGAVRATSAPAPALVAWAEQKHHVRARALELGVPVAPGEVVTVPVAGGRRRRDYDALRAAVERHLRPTGQVIVRGAQGAAGAATFVVGGRGEDVEGLLRRLSRQGDNRTYLVEVMVVATASPHLQLHVPPAGGTITCVGVTDQRWERPFVHGGNIHPSAGRRVRSMLDWSGRIARSLQAEGYCGLLGLDFVEYADPSTREPCALLAEVHPGADGASCPLALHRELNAVQRRAGRPESAAFVSGGLEVRPCAFDGFRRAVARFLYSPLSGRGMLPYEVGRLSQGRCGVLVLGGSRGEVLRAYGELQTWARRTLAEVDPAPVAS
jgi:hypothetical protein